MAEESKALDRERLKKVGGWGVIVVGAIAQAADLTADLPVAWPRWLSWLNSVPEPVYDAVFFLAFLVIVVLWVRGQRELRLKSAPAAVAEHSPAQHFTDSPAREPHAPNETVEQFRTFYHFLARAVQWAIDFLDAGVCGTLPSEGPKAAVSQLIRELLLPACRENKERLDSIAASGGEWTESRFTEAIGRARLLLNGDYRRLTLWILRAGSLLDDQELEFISMPGYLELRHLHWELFEEARRIRTHSRLRGIVPTMDIEGFLPGMSRQWSTTSFGAMSALELRAHVHSEGLAGFINREWSPERLTIFDRKDSPEALDLDCKTDSGHIVLLRGVRTVGLNELLHPGKRIHAWGTIREITFRGLSDILLARSPRRPPRSAEDVG